MNPVYFVCILKKTISVVYLKKSKTKFEKYFMEIDTSVKEALIPAKKPRATSNKKKTAKIDRFFEKPVTETVQQQPVFVETPEQIVPVANEPVIFLDEKEPIFSFLNKKNIFWMFLFVLIVSLVGMSGYFYFQYKKATAVDAGKNEIASYVLKIGKFMILPEGEEPTMATVADKERLSSQSFFAKAENGDKVLFFSKSQKAILYRPSQNMIIEATAMAGGISNGTVPNSEVVSPAKQSPPVIEESAPVQNQSVEQVKNEDVKMGEVVIEDVEVIVNNGTSQKGLAKTVAEKISKLDGVNVVSTGNTVGNFDKTIVVDFSGKNAGIAEKIASELGGEVGNLPSSEINPEADILIIAGKL